MATTKFADMDGGNGLFMLAQCHYLNQFWLIISKVVWYSTYGNVTGNAQDINWWNVFQIYTFEITAIFTGDYNLDATGKLQRDIKGATFGTKR